MKKRLLVLIMALACLLCLMLTGCDVNAKKRPTNYPSTTWVCEAPEITFRVDEQGYLHLEMPEAANIPEDLELAFDFGNRVFLYSPSHTGELFVGECTFLPYKMYVNVTKDLLFDGAYTGKQILFRRAEKATFDEYLSVFAIPVLLILIIGYFLIRLLLNRRSKKKIQ